MKNTGVEYEVIVQNIFQQILNQDFAKNINVQRDVKIVGKSGITHQVDVFWEFEIGEITYSSVIQVKDWKSSVKQEQILTLKSVLDDIPKQPRGIIVTKKGFQNGALQFAEKQGIELYKLEETNIQFPIEVKPFSFAIQDENGWRVYGVSFSDLSYEMNELDNTWIAENAKLSVRKDIVKSLDEKIQIKNVDELKFYNENKMEVYNLRSLLNDAVDDVCDLDSFMSDDTKKVYNNPIKAISQGESFTKKNTKIFDSPVIIP